MMQHQHMPTDSRQFEPAYISLRRKEGRMYTDDEVLQLPNVPPGHQLVGEWKQRKRSAHRLESYLRSKKQALNILEIGCGNGWLSHRLSCIPNVTVTGTDINETELLQALRVFQKDNLNFFTGDIRELDLRPPFDAIVFAASFQYFFPAASILDRCLQLLQDDGEVHIIDTAFYSEADAVLARQRSAVYFLSMGAADMNAFYFHHTEQSLADYRWRYRHKPNAWSRFFFRTTTFPWIVIQP
jgi:SAM-dependent methyltransferase